MTQKLNKRGDRRGMVGTPYSRSGDENPHWKGGKHLREDGYILIRIGIISSKTKGTKYRLEHRIVMEESLGRPLLRSEVVHHKDGNTSNNNIDNLELITQSEHAKIHYKERVKNNGRLV